MDKRAHYGLLMPVWITTRGIVKGENVSVKFWRKPDWIGPKTYPQSKKCPNGIAYLFDSIRFLFFLRFFESLKGLLALEENVSKKLISCYIVFFNKFQSVRPHFEVGM